MTRDPDSIEIIKLALAQANMAGRGRRGLHPGFDADKHAAALLAALDRAGVALATREAAGLPPVEGDAHAVEDICEAHREGHRLIYRAARLLGITADEILNKLQVAA